MTERQIAWSVVIISVIGAAVLSAMDAWGAGWLIFLAFVIALGLMS